MQEDNENGMCIIVLVVRRCRRIWDLGLPLYLRSVASRYYANTKYQYLVYQTRATSLLKLRIL